MTSKTATVKAELSSGNVTFSLLGDSEYSFSPCGEPIEARFLVHTFFSFFAKGADDIGDSELYHVMANWAADVSESFNISEIDDQSRAIIANEEGKVSFVRPVMPLASRVIAEMEESAFKLGRAAHGNATDEIRALLVEVRERLNKSLSAADVKRLMHAAFGLRLVKVEKKIEKKKGAFLGISEDLHILKMAIVHKLYWLTVYVRDTMVEAKVTAVDTLNAFLEIAKNSTELAREAKTRAREANAAVLPKFLYIVAIVELLCYLAFFCIKRRRTHGFKKYE
jgi:hypothetical protein